MAIICFELWAVAVMVFCIHLAAHLLVWCDDNLHGDES